MRNWGILKVTQGLTAYIQSLPYTHPWKVISIALLMAAAGGYLYYFHLPIVSDREKLADQDYKFNRLNTEYQNEFGNHTDFLILVVKVKSPTHKDFSTPAQRTAMKKAGKHWADLLQKRPDLFPVVTDRIDWSAARASPLYYLPYENFEQIIDSFITSLPLLGKWITNPSLAGLFETINYILSAPQSIKTEGSDNLQILLNTTSSFLRIIRLQLEQSKVPDEQVNPLKNLTSMINSGSYDPDGYFFSKDGTILTVYTLPARDSGVQNRYSRAMVYARESLREVLSDKELAPLVDAGLAGMPALEEEEMAMAQSDFGRSGLLTLFFVSLLFMAGFRNVSRPAMATLCLSLSIAITFLFTWLVIGELNYLATIFAVILIALGVDFAIHFFTHYQRAISEGLASSEAIQRTQEAIGGALWMSGMATAVAFFSIMFTDFPGLQDLGLIAGMGLIISLMCMYLVFPSLLFLLDTYWRQPSANAVRKKKSASNIPGKSFLRKAGIWLFLPASLLAITGYYDGQYFVDTNLLNLQAIHGEANRWQRLLLAVDDRASFTIATFRDRTSLENAQFQLQQNPQLIRSTTAVFPEREADKQTLTEPLCYGLSAIIAGKAQATPSSSLEKQLFHMHQILLRYKDFSNEAETVLAPVLAEIEILNQLLDSLQVEETDRRLSLLQHSITQSLIPLTGELKELFCPQPFEIQHSPLALQQQFVGKDGSLALIIYPQKNSWDRANLEEFITYVRSIIPNAFGGIAAIHDNGIIIIHSFMQAAIYSFIAMLFLLLLLTRSLRITLLALLPLLIGFGLLLAVMKWWIHPIQWNLANLFALPILIGIGIDGGVHLARAYQQPHCSIFQGALKAITYSSLTTMIGFGILATGVYQGGASLGLVLFIGISLNLFACLVLLPPVLEFFLKPHRSPEQ